MAGLDLGKPVGPLPLGAWIAVVAGGLGIAWYTKSSGGAVGDDGTDDVGTGNPSEVGNGAVGGWSSTTPTTGNNADTDPTTNQEWAVMVINGLIAKNYDPTLIDSAIRKYISGANDLSVSEFTIIRLALATYGSPPEVLPATGQTPPSNSVGNPPPTKPTKPVVTKPTTPVKKYRYYVVKKGDTLWGISKKYYGTGLKWGTIYNANRTGKKRADGTAGIISNANLIRNGWKLIIP